MKAWLLPSQLQTSGRGAVRQAAKGAGVQMADLTGTTKAAAQLKQLKRRPLAVVVVEPADLVADALAWARELADMAAGPHGGPATPAGDERGKGACVGAGRKGT